MYSALNCVKYTIKSKQNENDLEIYIMYSKNVGQVLSRRCLMQKLVNDFENETVVLSSQDVDSILYKKFCQFILHKLDGRKNNTLKDVAAKIKKETQKTAKTNIKRTIYY